MNAYKIQAEMYSASKKRDCTTSGLDACLPKQKQKDVTGYKIPKLASKESTGPKIPKVTKSTSRDVKAPKVSNQQSATTKARRSRTSHNAPVQRTQSYITPADRIAACQRDKAISRDNISSQAPTSSKRIAWNLVNGTGRSQSSVNQRSHDPTAVAAKSTAKESRDHSGTIHPHTQAQPNSYTHPNAYLASGYWNHDLYQQHHHGDAISNKQHKQPTIGHQSTPSNAQHLTNGKIPDYKAYDANKYAYSEYSNQHGGRLSSKDLLQKQPLHTVAHAQSSVTSAWPYHDQAEQSKVKLSSRELLQKQTLQTMPRKINYTKEVDTVQETKIESIGELFPDPVCENDAQRALYVPKLSQEEVDEILAESRKPLPLSKVPKKRKTCDVVVDSGVRDTEDSVKKAKFATADPDISEELVELAERVLSGKPLRTVACEIKNEIFERVKRCTQLNNKYEYFDHSRSPIPHESINNKPKRKESEVVDPKVHGLGRLSSIGGKVIQNEPVIIPFTNVRMICKSESNLRATNVNMEKRRPQTKPAAVPVKQNAAGKADARYETKIENETVLVHVMEKISPMKYMKPVSNTRTPCPSPARHLDMQAMLSHVPFSTQSLLQRTDMKLNFFSEKQKKNPTEQLFKTKTDCYFNLDTVYDFKTNTWKQHKNFGRPEK